MALGSSLVPDLIPVSTGGATIDNLTAAQLSTKFGAGNVKTPTQDFAITVEGKTLTFKKGVPVVMDTHLQAHFTTHSAPVV